MADEEKKIINQENTNESDAETIKEASAAEEAVKETSSVEMKAEPKKTKTASKSSNGKKKKKKKSAYRRMIEHHIKVAAIIIGSIALVAVLFFTLIASYDFSKKAWHVKFDPIHGYSYTLYLKQEYTPAHIVIESCSKSSEEVTVPDTIFGARVETIGDGAFKSSVKTVKLGQYVTLVGEDMSDKSFVLPENYGTGALKSYVTFKDKNGSGFYYKAMYDNTMMAFAYFGTKEGYKIPESFGGMKVSKATEYYENDEYTSRLAEYEAEHYSVLPYNMIRVNIIRNEAIDPYVSSLEDLESRQRMKERIMSLPAQYNYNTDGTPADGETAIKLAFIHKGDGNGKNCGGVMADYDPSDFFAAVRYVSKRTSDCHTDGEPDFEVWMMDGFAGS